MSGSFGFGVIPAEPERVPESDEPLCVMTRNTAGYAMSAVSRLTARPGMTWRGFDYLTSTFLNCHGSLVSMSSGNSPGRPVSGVHSV